MLRLKQGVSLDGLTVPTLSGLLDVAIEYDKIGCDCWVTSGSEGDSSDGVHTPTSWHYVGRALDIRMRNVPDHLQSELFNRIKFVLGDTFDVIFYEGTKHLHVEYDPEA